MSLFDSALQMVHGTHPWHNIHISSVWEFKQITERVSLFWIFFCSYLWERWVEFLLLWLKVTLVLGSSFQFHSERRACIFGCVRLCMCVMCERAF